MSLNNRLSNITQNTTKTIRNATIWLALISALQSCENVTWASTTPTHIDSIKNNEDADIHTFESWLPYFEQWNQPFPAISSEDSMRLEEQFTKNTLRSKAQDEKPTMNEVKHVVLHSTEYPENLSIVGLQWNGKIHFIIKRNWELIQYLPTTSNRLVQANHIGKWTDESSNAMWNHNPFVTFNSIWIEVCALPAEQRTEDQYITIKKLLWYLGNKYNLIQKDVITHTMVAYSKKYWLMRKHDPFGIEWEKLWLAPGSAQINKDVVTWEIAPNLVYIYERLRKPKNGKNPWWAMTHDEAISYLQYHYSWVDNAIALHKRRFWWIWSTAQHWKIDKVWRMISDINENMKNYVPKIVIQKKWVNTTHHKKKRR